MSFTSASAYASRTNSSFVMSFLSLCGFLTPKADSKNGFAGHCGGDRAMHLDLLGRRGATSDQIVASAQVTRHRQIPVIRRFFEGHQESENAGS
jgi:hypothetical protein